MFGDAVRRNGVVRVPPGLPDDQLLFGSSVFDCGHEPRRAKRDYGRRRQNQVWGRQCVAALEKVAESVEIEVGGGVENAEKSGGCLDSGGEVDRREDLVVWQARFDGNGGDADAVRRDVRTESRDLRDRPGDRIEREKQVVHVAGCAFPHGRNKVVESAHEEGTRD